jgi:acetylornithine deacetylase/succinyl-diaminopimelate desuccinylase-like protein
LSPLQQRVSDIVEQDRQDLIDLSLQLGNLESPHGRERPAADAVAGWLDGQGIRSFLQPISETSANAVGVIAGSGRGTSLIMDAHLDTGSPLRADASADLRRIHGAWEEDGLLYGYGVVNDKGQLAAFMIAARALVKAGIRLRGDLIVAGVAHETGPAAPPEQERGISAPGEGFGSWWLVNRGVTADYALVGETSSFGLVTTETGSVFLQVRTTGRAVYTPRLQRGDGLADHPSSVIRMAEAVRAIEEWAIRYETDATVQIGNIPIVPKAQVKSVASTAWESIIDVDVRLVPGANPRAVTADIRDFLAARGISCTVEPYQWSRGYVATGAEPLIDAVTRSHTAVFDEEPPAPPVDESSMWRDLNVFNEVGIPSICYGAPRQKEALSNAGNRAMKVDDLLSATQVYALTALDLCG